MRIIVVTDHAHINGGLAKVAIDSAKGFARRGYRVDYFSAVGPVEPSLVEAGVSVTLLDQADVMSAPSLARFGAQWLWNAAAEHGLAGLLASCDPAQTIVHVHGWAKALSPSIGRALRRSGLPVVHTLHEFYLACPNGGFYDYGAARNCDYKAMSLGCIAHNCDSRGYHRKLMRIGRHALMLYASGLYETARHIISISKLQREVIAPYMPKDAVFYEVGNPIDVSDLGPKGDHAPADFVFVGRLSAEKGPRYFAQGARLAGVTPVFIGDGPEREGLEKEFPEAKFLGWRTPSEVREALRAARALVFPSVWYEGQPLTVYESLALGTPVIVSELCAGREAVVDGETGIWFKSSDAQSLAAAITRLKDDGLARRMAEAAYARYWAAPLTLDRHLDSVAAVYEKVQRHWRAAQSPA
ncbi:glycosyltransferase family 4 protein [Methylocystis sp. MJC1]|jgi:glycosyltransferase involved in cell wall biosynthesis|uniref:glycosyltransferase family 4 protein n=1 Tax=Methylocystis sp. MJC1 TaxID=2654282 RepID=UPI0013E9B468|nr:glycosyltransferase family 4 protein [Methylocystis sp. MJC1]KAF2990585.1 putative teichuronic acid biosynthesis glycosyltransferase TuaC [Methylocystis sp. MJC1]MBU6525754.1 glycosyltransferase family 4 protein [Methylocystis sp. MJC1]UZX13656.1 glycosyltransferase family 4 protein [Methylocystis sp. MJC1]